VLTNIAADHVDYFDNDFEAYVRAKLQMTSILSSGDTLVCNDEDPRCRALLEKVAAQNAATCVAFSSQKTLSRGWCGDGERMWWIHSDNDATELLAIDNLGVDGQRPPRGAHNVSNALAASAAVLAMGAPLSAIRTGLRSFEAPPHRNEQVGSIGDVRFINDSKATNPHAALAGLRALDKRPDERVIWIGGGSNKDADFTELAAELDKKVDCAVLIGETAALLDAALPGSTKRIHCGHMHEAVATALGEVGAKGAVLLSPACASFGLFRSYAHRGEVFVEAIQRLKDAIERL
jgi:UDP-N-acetylmuramoylalanine--D-glutamate ligase